MVSFAGLLAPALAMACLWFAGTALVAWAANRPRATFPLSLGLGGAAAVAGLALLLAAAPSSSPAAAYLSLLGGLAIWGWHELAFLTGAAAGPRRAPASARAGWPRFAEAAGTVIHHELALAATCALLLALTWDAPTRTGAEAFALLFALRLSAKLNLHAGVPNFSDELLPPHLAYLKTYFRRRPLGPLLLVSLAAAGALAVWLGLTAAALPPESGAAAGASLLFALALLGAVEHALLALPFRDGLLWRWALGR
jgi:putative photosynthetic complex assembly protein 2